MTYVRDLTDRIVARTEGASTTRMGYSGAGDVGAATLDTAGNVTERTIALPGGVLVTKRAAGDVWSYPNIHGDIAATANATGVKQGATFRYDPYGNTTTPPDNQAGNIDYGWLGQHQRLNEHATGIPPAIEMGARLYSPTIGRFLEVDPVDGGSCNDYDYTCADPSNGRDLDGKCYNRNPLTGKRTFVRGGSTFGRCNFSTRAAFAVAPSRVPYKAARNVVDAGSFHFSQLSFSVTGCFVICATIGFVGAHPVLAVGGFGNGGSINLGYTSLPACARSGGGVAGGVATPWGGVYGNHGTSRDDFESGVSVGARIGLPISGGPTYSYTYGCP